MELGNENVSKYVLVKTKTSNSIKTIFYWIEFDQFLFKNAIQIKSKLHNVLIFGLDAFVLWQV